MSDKPITVEFLDHDWRFWKSLPAESRCEIAAAEVMVLRSRDIYALCEHGQISTGGFNWFSEPKR